MISCISQRNSCHACDYFSNTSKISHFVGLTASPPSLPVPQLCNRFTRSPPPLWQKMKCCVHHTYERGLNRSPLARWVVDIDIFPKFRPISECNLAIWQLKWILGTFSFFSDYCRCREGGGSAMTSETGQYLWDHGTGKSVTGPPVIFLLFSC